MNQAEKLGYATLSPNRPLIGGELNTWRIEYICGKTRIKKGGGIRISLPRIWSSFQLKNPQLEGYTTISTNSQADLETSLGISSNPNAFQYLYVKLKEGHLVEGDKIRIIYGDTREGSIGSLCQTYPQDYFENDEKWWGSPSLYFLVWVDFEGRGQYQSIKENHRWKGKILSGRPVALMPIAPSIVPLGNSFNLNVIGIDRFGYDSPFPEDEEIENLAWPNQHYPIEKKSSRIKVVKNIKFEKPGSYHIEIRSRNGLYGRSNPIVVKDKPEWNVYWGDIHIHSSLCDGRKTPEDIYPYCRDVQKLDFTSISNHDWGPGMTDDGWKKFKEITNRYHKPGEFVTLIGYEWTNWEEDGNRNVYFVDDDPPIFRYSNLAPMQGGRNNQTDTPYRTAKELWNALKGIEAIVIPHHPLACMNYNFNKDLEPVVEIYSCWGSSEYRGNPLWVGSKEKDSGQFWKGGLSVQEILSRGYKFGFICGSDNHGGMPGGGQYRSPYLNLSYHRGGLTAIMAPELTRESIFEAIRQRRCYGTTGDRIIIDFRINGHFMGEQIQVSPGAPLKITVSIAGSDVIEKIELIRDNETISLPGGGSLSEQVEFSLRPKKQSGVEFYYLRVQQCNGEIAWTSPIWIMIP